MKVLFLTNNIEISEKLFKWLSDKCRLTIFQNKLDYEFLNRESPNLVISYNYKYIIKNSVLSYGCEFINLHISFLPYNRGMHPNVWSFIEGTPKGVTIHRIDEGLDTGPILIRKEVFFDEDKETLRSSYLKLHEVMFNLFVENWENIKNNKIIPFPQKDGGTIHYKKDFGEKIAPLIKDIGWDIKISELKKRYKEAYESV